MDAVYVTKDGENPELRYSLRTLKNVKHERVWVFGGAPSWLDKVIYRPRSQSGSPYRSTREHIAAACNTPEVSDPFLLWNDDFYAITPVGDMPILHRGPMSGLEDRFSEIKTPWARGLRETAEMLRDAGYGDAVSYDLHVPLVIHKAEMRAALRVAKKAKSDAIHLRSLYGNLAELGGTRIEDPKLHRPTDPFPEGPWMSSSSSTFRSTVEPVLRYLFPDPSIYERG